MTFLQNLRFSKEFIFCRRIFQYDITQISESDFLIHPFRTATEISYLSSNMTQKVMEERRSF